MSVLEGSVSILENKSEENNPNFNNKDRQLNQKKNLLTNEEPDDDQLTLNEGELEPILIKENQKSGFSPKGTEKKNKDY